MIKYKNVRVIRVQDWDRLVIDTYGKPYSFQQQDGCKSRGVAHISTHDDYIEDFENDTVPEIINGDEMGVSFKAWLEKDPKAPLNPSEKELKSCNYYYGGSKESWKKDKHHIELFWGRNFYPHVSMIAKDLYDKGLLEEGEYTINIDW